MSSNEKAIDLVREEDIRPTLVRIKAEKQLVRHAMEAVMKNGMHYGTIPGTQKPTLFDAGATTILGMFHIALDPETEDLSVPDEIRYRVRQVARHSPTGTLLGSAYGEASSNEEKYKWRRAVCKEEFDATPEDRRRVKWGKGKWENGREGKAYQTQQVRTEPADIANTVLKMAAKRARVATTLQVTGASDVFAQDLEDLPAEVVENLEEDKPAPPAVPVNTVEAKKQAEVAATKASFVLGETKLERQSKPDAKNPWKVFRIHTESGQSFVTKDGALAAMAQELEGCAVTLTSIVRSPDMTEVTALEAVKE
jgi:hypothetical protein